MILFVDDEEEMDSYRMGLELSGYEVVLQTKLDDAWEQFNLNQNQIELVILDISMPPGNLLKEHNTLAGMRTGVVLFEMIRESAPAMPIIIFTNVSDEKIKTRFSNELSCFFLQKPEELPSTLAEKVKRLLSTSDSLLPN